MDVAPVTVDAIDFLLREARVCCFQLQCIHSLLNDDPNWENEEWRRRMEANTAMIFRDMVSYLYSVLDSIYYFLYCHFQNNGTVSFTNAAFNIKQPINLGLKYSQNPGRDNGPECKRKRNDWVEDRCEEIFGAQYYQNDNLSSRLADLRGFQNYLLSIQAITEVNDAGGVVLGGNGGVKLVSACNILHPDPQAGPDRRFNPTSIDFQELPSVENMDYWNEAMIFNLLHFFRNFTTHRTLIECQTRDGYLNVDTGDFRPVDENRQLDPAQWIRIARGSWIKVPELSHLRHRGRVDPITFYKLPMLRVCSKLMDFVRVQRHNLLIIVGGRDSNMNDQISFGWVNNDRSQPRVTINGEIKE